MNHQVTLAQDRFRQKRELVPITCTVKLGNYCCRMLQIQKVYMDPKTSEPNHPQKALPAKDPTSALGIV